MDTVNETHERGELARLYREHRGKVSDRWRSYLDNYDRLFSSYREKPVRILEIGVQNGGSLDLWLHYFPNAKIIVGCDIDPSCAALEYDDPRIRVVVGDASAAGTAARIHEISDHFDITIDDGSHMARDVIRSFAVYFPRLTEGGLYVVEDLHCSYMHGYEGGLQAPYSSMSFFKRLADLVNREFWGCDLPLEAPLAYFARKSGATFEPRSLSLIESVSFRNSLCVIAKGAPEANALGERIVAGQSAIVDPVVARLDGNRFHGTDETSNPFGPLSRSSEEHVEERPVHFRRALSQNARILALQSEARDLKVALAGAKRADYDGRLPRKLRGLKRWLPGSGREIRQRTREYRIIAASALFDADWYLANNPDVAARKFDPVYHYLRYGAAEGRAPGPHFDAQDYLRANPDVAANGTNPLLDYLRHCRAKERRLSLSAPAISETLPQIKSSGGIASSLQPNPVLTTGTWRRAREADYSLAIPIDYVGEPRDPPGSVAAIVHVFYDELAVELRSYLDNVPGALDVFISTTDAQRKSVIELAFAGWAKGTVEVRLAPNRGRDIAPKLVGFRDVYDRYEFVLHAHTKRSPHATKLANWRRYLLASLVGSPLVVSSVFEAFGRNPRLGLVAAQHFEPVREWIQWTGNFDRAALLAARMGFSIDPRAKLDFPSGSMFWARSAALRPLLELELATEDFEPERDERNQTLAHAIEHLYFHVCERAGFDWIKIARPKLLPHTPAICAVTNPRELNEFFALCNFRLLTRHIPGSFSPKKEAPGGIEP